MAEAGGKARLKFVVAGGGIGGLASALGLANKGCQVTVLEQAGSFGEIGAGIQIGPNAFHAMDYLGIGEAARKVAVYIDRLVMMDATSGDQVAQIPVDEPFRKRFRNPYAVVHRADLHGVYLDACKAHPNITLLTRQKVLTYENVKGGARVRTEASDVFEGHGVIGCDGGRSKIREQLTGGDPLRVTGHVAYRAVLPIDRMPEELRWNAATLWGGPKCHMVHYPLQGWKTFNLVAVFVGESMDVRVNEPGSRDEVLSRFGKSVPIVRRLLEVPTEWRRWSLADREPIENWTDGRVTLLGDAAHLTLQYFAQGACMAMEDAVNLSDKVGKFGDDLEGAFAAYQKERIIRAYRVVLSSRMLGMMFHARGVERLIRNSVLGARKPEEFYNSLEWLYGGNGLTA